MLDMDCLASLLHLVKPTALALLNTTATATTSRLSATQHHETFSLAWTSRMAPTVVGREPFKAAAAGANRHVCKALLNA